MPRYLILTVYYPVFGYAVPENRAVGSLALARDYTFGYILTDPENKIVLDILPERYKPYLTIYFSKYSKEEREKVNTLFQICGELIMIHQVYGLKTQHG